MEDPGNSTAWRLASGAVAGAAGVWAMDRVDWFLVGVQDPAAWRTSQAVRPHGKDPAHNMAGMLANALGMKPPPQPHAAGIAVHYAVGILPSALYGVVRDRLPAGPARGLLFGIAAWALADELMGPLTGAAAPPGRYPWQTHARSLVAHLVFGAVTDAVFIALAKRSRAAARMGPAVADDQGDVP